MKAKTIDLAIHCSDYNKAKSVLSLCELIEEHPSLDVLIIKADERRISFLEAIDGVEKVEKLS